MELTAAELADIPLAAARAIAEDLGAGDVSARLVPSDTRAEATIIARESAIWCGRPWAEAVFRQLDTAIKTEWPVAEGERVEPDQVVCRLRGPARAMLSGERAALNFLQTLSGTATTVARYVEAIAGTSAVITDTRKTLPGLRLAQKYAVRCGGGRNHRIGLYDGILIKENHIAAAGGIRNALAAAKALRAPVPLMTEAETLEEVDAALEFDVDLLLVDDFDDASLREAVRRTRAHREGGGKTVIEYSGGATLETVRGYAEAGVDRIAIGAITKHLRAVDLSMRFA